MMDSEVTARKLPTRPGWWLARIGDGAPFCSRVWVQGMDNAMIATDADCGHRLVSAWAECEFPAPIPGPAVLAALAECAMAWNEIDERNAIAAKRGPDVPVAASARTARAIDRLRDAIRAERDGAA